MMCYYLNVHFQDQRVEMNIKEISYGWDLCGLEEGKWFAVAKVEISLCD